jgi:hypothetical protein
MDHTIVIKSHLLLPPVPESLALVGTDFEVIERWKCDFHVVIGLARVVSIWLSIFSSRGYRSRCDRPICDQCQDERLSLDKTNFDLPSTGRL